MPSTPTPNPAGQQQNISTNPKTIVSLPVSARFIIPTLGISLDKVSLAFGDIIKGEDSKKQTLTITNTGNMDVNLTLQIQGEDDNAQGFYDQSLYVDDVLYVEGTSIGKIAPGQSKDISVQMKVPLTWDKPGVLKATFIFWAEAR